MEGKMTKDFCKDCGMLLSPHTSLCSVCGFDNKYDDDFDTVLESTPLIKVSNNYESDHRPAL